MKPKSLLRGTVVLGVALATGCSDDSPTGPGLLGSEGDIGVLLENHTGEMLGVQQTEDHNIRFCYQGEGCEEPQSVGRYVGTLDTVLVHATDRDDVVGVIVEVEVTGDEGSRGEVQVVTGTWDEEGFGVGDFEVEETVHTEGPFNDGDIVSFTVGDTD